jgi:hypothetical protein
MCASGLLALCRNRTCFAKICDISYISVNNLRNGVRKNGNGGLFNRASGAATIFPGMVVELDYSGALKVSRRDISLWLNNSGIAVTCL